MTLYQSFNEMRDALFALYGQEQFSDALALLDKEADRWPDRRHDKLYYAMCLLGRLGRTKEAVQNLQAALDMGHWYGPSQLSADDDDLKLIWDNPEFQHLRDISLERFAMALADVKHVLAVQAPENSQPPYPTLLALHGNTGNAVSTLGDWMPAVGWGWMVASAQSTQLVAPNAYVWNDFETATRDIQHYFTKLTGNVDHVILAGFSMGAGFAAYAALKDIIPVRGFILVAPSIPDMERLASMIEAKKGSDLRGYILIGDKDTISLSSAEALAAKMHENDLTVEYELRAGLGHSFPSDFEGSLRKALAFVMG